MGQGLDEGLPNLPGVGLRRRFLMVEDGEKRKRGVMAAYRSGDQDEISVHED